MKYSSDQSLITRLTDKLKVALGRKYLDWAESLPEFKGGVIASLQHARRFQRKEAEKSLERSHLPTGLSIRYSLCAQMELFPLESVDDLDSAIKGLFPKSWPEHDSREFIRSAARGLHEGDWCNVGVLVRESRYAFGPPVAMVESLPPEVEYISVQVYKVLSSSFVAYFCAFLNDRATSGLGELLSATYLPAIRFRRWVPSGPLAGGYTQTPADRVRENALQTELLRIRTSIENVIGRYFQGYFFRERGGEIPKLPAIEAFDLLGVPRKGEELSWGWGAPLGLGNGTVTFDGYARDKQIFIFSNTGRSGLPVAHRLIMLHDTPEDSTARDQRLWLLADELIATIAQGLTLLEMLRQIRRAAEALRMRIYRRLAENPWLMGFRGDIRLHRRLQKESLLLNRLALELEQSEKIQWRGPADLASFHALYKKRKERDLDKDLCDRIDFQLDTTSKHIEFVSKCFSDYVATRNMDLTFRLQIQVYVLAALAFLATILPPMVEYWPSIRAAFHRLLNLFGS